MPQQPATADFTVTKRDSLRYLLYLPEDYDRDPGKDWPLILFLHGSGERGDDLETVKNYGLAKKLESWPDCPFIVVSPQCPAGLAWFFKFDALTGLLDLIEQNYRVDRQRVYLTGLSMGGNGTWELATLHPERFAAIAPICGRGISLSPMEQLKEMPIWVFHGAKDPVVPISESERMVEGLRNIGNEVRFTVYPDAGHNSWTATYDNPELYAWFLEHHL
jgi:predicted peptidase